MALARALPTETRANIHLATNQSDTQTLIKASREKLAITERRTRFGAQIKTLGSFARVSHALFGGGDLWIEA